MNFRGYRTPNSNPDNWNGPAQRRNAAKSLLSNYAIPMQRGILPRLQKHVPGERIDIRLGCHSQTAGTHFHGNVNRSENLILTPALERYRILLVSLAQLAEFLAVRAPVVSMKTRQNPE